eukprot:SAG11_NODE_157_length_14147_cov_8.545202_3_plen_46_part_00
MTEANGTDQQLFVNFCTLRLQLSESTIACDIGGGQLDGGGHLHVI